MAVSELHEEVAEGNLEICTVDPGVTDKPAKIARVAELSPLELMGQRIKRMRSTDSVAYGRSFLPRPTDVFVVTYPKCGTTWVTQICHQLRSGGHMDFDEITTVCPWDVMARDCLQDLDADQVGNPRVFKSHEHASNIAKGGKYIHVCRDPMDAFVSFLRFLPAYSAIPPGQISVEEFAEFFFGGRANSGGIWDFFMGWWERKDDLDVLWVCYEDLRTDLRSQIKRIAKFMEVAVDEELLDLVEQRSSFEFMQAHQAQFDDHFVYGMVRDQMGIPVDYVFAESGITKVRAKGGVTGEGNRLPPSVLEMLHRRWQVSVHDKIGLSSYAALRAAFGSI